MMRSYPCSVLCVCGSSSDESHPEDRVDKRDREGDDDKREAGP